MQLYLRKHLFTYYLPKVIFLKTANFYQDIKIIWLKNEAFILYADSMIKTFDKVNDRKLAFVLHCMCNVIERKL